MTTVPIAIKMTTTEAEQITTKIVLRIETIASNSEIVVGLIEQAKAGSAHEALGFPSWTAYVADKFGGSLARLQKADRVGIVATLAETGMSVRAIASVTETSVGTVHNDVIASGVQELNTSRTVTGTDGKEYVRPATFLRSGKPDARSVEDIGHAVPPIKQKPRRRPLPDSYRDAVFDLRKAMEKLQRLHRDDRFPANRLAIGHFWSALADAELLLMDLQSELNKDLVCDDCGLPRTASILDSLCSNCRRRRDPKVLGPCTRCNAVFFKDCACES